MIENMKGGVGKTALAIHLAYAMVARDAKSVLLIDFDPQSNASLAILGANKYFDAIENGKSISHVLTPNPPNDPFKITLPNKPPSVKLDEVTETVRSFVYWKSRLPGNR